MAPSAVKQIPDKNASIHNGACLLARKMCRSYPKITSCRTLCGQFKLSKCARTNPIPDLTLTPIRGGLEVGRGSRAVPPRVVVYILHYLILPTVIYGFCADLPSPALRTHPRTAAVLPGFCAEGHGLTMKCWCCCTHLFGLWFR